MPGESYRRRLRSLLLYSCYVFRALINKCVDSSFFFFFFFFLAGGGGGGGLSSVGLFCSVWLDNFQKKQARDPCQSHR